MLKDNKYLYYVLLFALFTVVSDACYILIDCSQYITKTIARAIFVIFGVVNLLLVWKKLEKKSIKQFNILMILGLIFAFLGDILLIDFFIVGALLFGVGHVFYLIAFISLSKYKFIDIICGIGIFAISCIILILYPYFDFSNMLVVVYSYALIISLMLGKALGNYISDYNNVKSLIILIGAFLFFFSDVMLLFNVFANAPILFDILCLLTYYPAEYLLGLTILLDDKKITIKNITETNKS